MAVKIRLGWTIGEHPKFRRTIFKNGSDDLWSSMLAVSTPQAVKVITNLHYLHDHLNIFHTSSGTQEILQQVMRAHQHKGLRLRSVVSNFFEILLNKPTTEGALKFLTAIDCSDVNVVP